jgi:hypothetical protein
LVTFARFHGRSFIADGKAWRKNLALLQALGEKCRDGAIDNQNLVTIVDEAHALINPENPGGGGQFGFATSLGPQAYHIIRSSLLSVFLLDPLQGFRERENTSVEEIRAWSRELDAGEPDEISLEGAQFRCAGSAEYITWVESLLGGAAPDSNRELARVWRSASVNAASRRTIVPFPAEQRGEQLRAAEDAPAYAAPQLRVPTRETSGFDFQIFDDPETWENAVRVRCQEGNSARLLASYCREWKTADAADPHKLPPELMDFHERYQFRNERRFWSRVWNFVPKKGTDYTWYVSAHPAGRIARDPLCEVGCPYAVRGFDYDYVGIIWLDDLVWRCGKWTVNPKSVHESGIKDLRGAALNESPPGPLHTALRQRVAQSYRILFSRALRGAYVWIPDEETRGYLSESL